ncbi:MAG: methylated-DNA--[protein]-cysteine S-methyltransferase [Candidatus Sericytochromatia bacterium]|nr:methylated-DNA--[protein]-cysteine S-methyltransferase [Candidatus Sericytochromatia bacterium]
MSTRQTNDIAGSDYVTADGRRLALQQRAPSADGQCVCSVAATDVFCRPTCPSRPALRKTVAFHDTDAVLAGFRPCKRCRPDEALPQSRHAEAVTQACRLIEAADALGMKPGDYQRGGLGVDIRFTITTSLHGSVLVAGTDRGICSVRFGDDPAALTEELQANFLLATIVPADRAFGDWVDTVLTQIAHPGQTVDLPLDIQGTAFRQRVWQILRDIPLGQTASDTGIAQRIGQPTAARAVAGACASNPVAVIVPCHRAVRTDGGLSGYRWGIDRKRALLEQEGAF